MVIKFSDGSAEVDGCVGALCRCCLAETGGLLDGLKTFYRFRSHAKLALLSIEADSYRWWSTCGSAIKWQGYQMVVIT